jgi:predicted RNA-binding Zn ribbon-like protein
VGEKYLFVGNAAWLDFVNTEVMSNGEPADLIGDYADLADWLVEAGLASEKEAGAARARWGATREGARALDEARRFRAVLRATAERLAAGRRVGDDAVAAINAVLARPVHATELRREGGRFARAERWAFASATDALAPVAESARDMLCDGDLSLVRKCRNPNCILFFYDTTKNHARAWCSMSGCGNRTKVAAHYRRRRAARD